MMIITMMLLSSFTWDVRESLVAELNLAKSSSIAYDVSLKLRSQNRVLGRATSIDLLIKRNVSKECRFREFWYSGFRRYPSKHLMQFGVRDIREGSKDLAMEAFEYLCSVSKGYEIESPSKLFKSRVEKLQDWEQRERLESWRCSTLVKWKLGAFAHTIQP
jgi:hypothetical protein